MEMTLMEYYSYGIVLLWWNGEHEYCNYNNFGKIYDDPDVDPVVGWAMKGTYAAWLGQHLFKITF